MSRPTKRRGCKIAQYPPAAQLCRLQISNKKVDVKMPIKSLEYSVGDKLRIRSWNDMAEEFGDAYGVINTGNILFLESMRYLCEETFTIAQVYYDGDLPCYFSEEGIECRDRYGSRRKPAWIITSDMLEPIGDSREEDFYIATDNEMFEFLWGSVPS